MAYCTSSDLAVHTPKRTYGASTTPTSTQVSTYCDMVSAEIDAVLEAKGYTVPVTSPTNFVNLLKYIASYGAAALAEHAMFPETSEMGQTPSWKMLQAIYKDWLAKLADGTIIPASLSQGSASVGAASYGEQNQDTFPEAAFPKSSETKDF